MKLQNAEVCGCANCEGTDEGCVGEACYERAWREQTEREESEAVVRENGIRFAINQHICED